MPEVTDTDTPAIPSPSLFSKTRGLMSDDLVALWARWTIQRRSGDRELLVNAYTVLVRRCAARCFARRVGHELEYADFVQFGMVGLLECIDRFDPDRGARFETYATYRIEGAILSGISSLSELQQQVDARRRVLRERNQSLLSGAESHGSALERLAEVSIGLALGFALEDSGLYEDGEAATPDNAYSRVEMTQLKLRLAELVQRLPEQQRAVIDWHYFQQVKFEDIAVSLTLTKGRVSQIHHSALRGLRELHRKRGGDLGKS